MTGQFIFLLNKASKAAPAAPSPAASVGVAIPARMVPMTARISARGGIRDLSVMTHFWAADQLLASSLEIGGPELGLRLQRIKM
jgi:hypothetical protein